MKSSTFKCSGQPLFSNVLHDPGFVNQHSRGTLDLKTGILHIPQLLDQKFWGWMVRAAPSEWAFWGRRLLLVKVQGDAGAEGNRGSSLVVCGLSCGHSAKDQIGSYSQRQDRLKRLVPPPTHQENNVVMCWHSFRSYWKWKWRCSSVSLTHLVHNSLIHRISKVRILGGKPFPSQGVFKPRDRA